MSLLSILPVIVTLGGAFVIVKLRAFFILHPVRTGSALIASLRSRSARSSLALALAGTLGVGNIVGVAVGISVGGAGSVFWLLVSSLFASALKYAESSLSAYMRSESGGGIMYVLRSSFRFGVQLSTVYAFFCLLLAFVMGAALQTSSVVSSAAEMFPISPLAVGAMFLIPVVFVVIRGAEKIDKFTAVVIPITTVIYILLSLITVFSNFSRIPFVVESVLSSAFRIESASGGIIGFFTSSALREGYSRGLLSNEAGAGTSSLAHSRSDVAPASAGLLGMCEVFFDTTVLCTLTALAVLTSVPDPSSFSSGMSLILASVGSCLGTPSRILVMLCIAAFAFSTVICWYYYGDCALSFLFKGGKKIYLVLFLASVLCGAVFSERALIYTSDYILLILTALTVMAIIKNSDRLYRLSESSGLIIHRS